MVMERPNSQQTHRCHLMCPSQTHKHTAPERPTALRDSTAFPCCPFGTPVVPIWYTRDTHLEHPWYQFCTPAVSIWYTRGTHLVHPWYPFRTPVVPIWYTRGTHLVHPWYPFGTLVVLHSFTGPVSGVAEQWGGRWVQQIP